MAEEGRPEEDDGDLLLATFASDFCFHWLMDFGLFAILGSIFFFFGSKILFFSLL